MIKRIWNNDKNETLLQAFLHDIEYLGGVHGLAHAKRVECLALMLAKTTNADVDVLIWFAYVHDCRRKDDGIDYSHGPEAAEYVNVIRHTYLKELDDNQITLLKTACRLHTSTHRTGESTIDTCFDADRLDLPRVGIATDPKRMATETGTKFAQRSYRENLEEAKFLDLLCEDLLI